MQYIASRVKELEADLDDIIIDCLNDKSTYVPSGKLSQSKRPSRQRPNQL